ncbi:MAG: tRNA epoxyqueuosine(34) reductase QueG [Verrucomicrobiota bacterium]
MSAVIRQHSLTLGFDACRITTATPPASHPQFQQWLANGHHGEMAWIARGAEKRGNLELILPGVKSVITLAAAYESTNAVGGSGTGAIARYARHHDYHEVLQEPLKRVTERVNESCGPGTRSLWYTDTGPILERDLAQRAGLGFIGKHTNLISPTLGNWFFLAEILTTASLTPDAPAKNRCGSCIRCLTVCPTQAILAPFQLDARLCLSYLTIEHKGAIPEALRPQLGNRIFGCDECLAACPWNRFASEGRLMRTHARHDLAQPDLLHLLAMDDAAFKRTFAGTPMERAKRRGLLRNVCVALGNTGTHDALPQLEQHAHGGEPMIAEHAQWAMATITRNCRR